MIEAPKFAELCLSTSFIAIPTCLTSLASSGFIGNHYHDDNDEIPNVGSVDPKENLNKVEDRLILASELVYVLRF
jgi:hypothetical protein